jgi:hypothetical protein
VQKRRIISGDITVNDLKIKFDCVFLFVCLVSQGLGALKSISRFTVLSFSFHPFLGLIMFLLLWEDIYRNFVGRGRGIIRVCQLLDYIYPPVVG